MVSPLLLALAVSLDSLGVGIAYGVKKVTFPISAYLIVGACTFLLMGISMGAGTFMAAVVSPRMALVTGGLILIGIGLGQLYSGWRSYLRDVSQKNTSLSLLHVRIPFLGIMIQILRDPQAADIDDSRGIDPKEAYALGMALGLDAFAAGFGASMAGFSFALLPLVAIFCACFVGLGITIGKASVNRWWKKKGFLLPGLILIGLGLFQIMY